MVHECLQYLFSCASRTGVWASRIGNAPDGHQRAAAQKLGREYTQGGLVGQLLLKSSMLVFYTSHQETHNPVAPRLFMGVFLHAFQRAPPPLALPLVCFPQQPWPPLQLFAPTRGAWRGMRSLVVGGTACWGPAVPLACQAMYGLVVTSACNLPWVLVSVMAEVMALVR